nr:sigma-54 dependent transcriptional regulator [Aliikangiella sp. G2MR2-5]
MRASLLRQRLNSYSEADSSRYSIKAFLGKSEPVKKVKGLLEQLKSVPLTSMVITGETGTGKGLAAGIVHYSGQRKNGPFIELNCAALPRELLESQLFGHEAGAFTGAKSRHKGLFEQADGGTLFLDEIGDMDLELQSKLLKAIEEQKIRRLGSEKEINIDVQIIAATGLDLQQAVIQGDFRDDLYHRLSVFHVELPALRERKEDLLDLVPHFIAEYNSKAKKNVNYISDETWELLLEYDWPGNVRELRNVLERCVLLSQSDVLPVEWLQLKQEMAANIDREKSAFDEDALIIPLDGSLALDDMEKIIIEAALDRTQFNVAEAARLLKTTRQTLRYRIKKFHITS